MYGPKVRDSSVRVGLLYSYVMCIDNILLPYYWASKGRIEHMVRMSKEASTKFEIYIHGSGDQVLGYGSCGYIVKIHYFSLHCSIRHLAGKLSTKL